MRFFVETLCLLNFASALHVLNISAHSATINLDASPEDRYRDVCTQYKTLMETNLQEIWNKALPQDVQDVIELLPLESLIPEEMRDELKGMFACTNLSTQQQFFLNFLYELIAYNSTSSEKMCTSIVAWSKKEKRIIHGHNLDFFFAEQFRNITIDYSFTRNGSVVYKCTSLLGTVGFEHCMVPGKFAVSINERNVGTIWGNIEDIIKKRSEVAYAVGNIMKQDSYKSALKYIQTVLLDAPVYFILSGTVKDEGAVVSRNNSLSVDTWTLDSANGRWFILETNYDHWQTPPADDNRRDPGNKHMAALGGSCSYQDMFEILSMEPTLNDGTIWTGVCSASEGEYDIVVRVPVS
jgi:N-acylethanolamine-hydrolysing acid amidase